MTTATAEYVQLRVGPKFRRLSPIWHRVEGERTACGFAIAGRGEYGTPPPGAVRCRNCEREWQTG